VGQVELEQLGFAGQDATDLLGEDAVAGLFIVEELAAFGGIVDDFGNLTWVSATGERCVREWAATFSWSTLSCPALVSDGPSKLCLRDLSLSSCPSSDASFDGPFDGSLDGGLGAVSPGGSAMLPSLDAGGRSWPILIPAWAVVGMFAP
jgi:hypothetical protein